MQEPSIFTKIINGEVPSYKIYEDEKTLAFLDIYPIQEGQVLVVPKKQVGFVWDLDDEDYQSLMESVRKVGQRMRTVFGHKQRVGVMIEGLDVTDHAHVKVFAFDDVHEYRNTPDTSLEPNHELLKALADKLAF